MTRVVRRSSKKYRWLSQGQDAILSRLAAARPQTNSIAPVFQPIQSGLTQRVRSCTAPSVVPSTRIGFSQQLAHARVRVLSPFQPRSHRLLQLSLFIHSKPRSHLRPRTSRRTITIAHVLDTHRCIQVDKYIPYSSRRHLHWLVPSTAL